MTLSLKNRQSGKPRQRLVRYFSCTWISARGPVDARISSLSPTGCYIDSRFTVPAVGAIVDSITVDAGTAHPLVLGGSVADSTPGIGFAVRFAELDEDTRAQLLAIVRPGQARPGL